MFLLPVSQPFLFMSISTFSTSISAIKLLWRQRLARRLLFLLGVQLVAMGFTQLFPDLLLWLVSLEQTANGHVFILAVVVLVLFSVLPLLLGILSVGPAFEAYPDRRARLALVIYSYISSILMFAGFYFVACSVASYERAVEQQDLVEEQLPKKWGLRPWSECEKELDRSKLPERQALKGVTYQAFVGVLDWQSPKSFPHVRPPWFSYPMMENLIVAMREEKTPFAWVNKDDTAGLFVECFHFSVVTAATVGYGDISPANTFMCLVVDFQILSSTAILVMGLGLAISGPADQGSKKDAPIKSIDSDTTT